MVIGTVMERIGDGAGQARRAVADLFAAPTVRLGVTGLSRAGKTVFITSLVANLVERGRMTGLVAARDGTIRAAYLQPQPDDTVPRFAFETHRDAMTGPDPHWPAQTRGISELRLSLRRQGGGLLGGFTGPSVVHLDIVDYPGEWLLDLGLIDKGFAEWSEATLARARRRGAAAEFLDALDAVDPTARLSEPVAQQLAAAFATYLRAARAAGHSGCTPGRFLLPGDLAGSPVLTFAPLPPGDAPRGSLAREFERRFEAYKREVVRPFFRDHFSRIDRQVVLIDVLAALDAGPEALEDLRRAMADILSAFRPGRNAFLSEIFGGRRVERILFAATKADHLHHTQHAALQRITEALVADARARADFAGAETRAIALASLRATTEDTLTRDGHEVGVVRGVLSGTGKRAAFHPGTLPEDPQVLLAPARAGAEGWPEGAFDAPDFAPQPVMLGQGEGPPHIRLDQAAQFLFGDRL